MRRLNLFGGVAGLKEFSQNRVAGGGVLGIGAKYHPVPWKLLRYDTEKRAYVVPMSKDDLEHAPMIDEHELSGWNDAQTRESIYGFYSTYGVGPYWG